MRGEARGSPRAPAAQGGQEPRPGCPGGTRRGWSAGPAGGASVEPRVTHFRPAASGLKGPNLAPNNNKTGARAAAPRLQSPPSCHLPPPGRTWPSPAAQLVPRSRPVPRSRGPRPRPSANSSRCARAASRDPLAAAAQSSRKGAVAAEDARPDCAAGGPARARRAAVAGPATVSQSGVRRSLAEPGPGGERCTRGRAPRPRRRHRPSSLVPAMAFVSPGALVTDLDTEY